MGNVPAHTIDGLSVLKSIGYFDSPHQKVPAFDPGPDGLCPICGDKIGERVRLCRSLMVSYTRSYFFSYHADCRDDDKLQQIEWRVVDEISDWDNLPPTPKEKDTPHG